MTLKEAAELLGTSPDNLRGAIARGALKAAKHGRDWWVEPSEVESYRKAHLRGVKAHLQAQAPRTARGSRTKGA